MYGRQAVARVAMLFGALLLGGCAAFMPSAPLIERAPEGKALVTFVRPAVFIGDGLLIYLWDRDRSLGILVAGALVQYQAEPGEHLFLASTGDFAPRRWTFAKANLEAGKQYFIGASTADANVFEPYAVYTRHGSIGTFGVASFTALSPNDEQVRELFGSLKPTTGVAEQWAAAVESNRTYAQAAVSEFDAGRIRRFVDVRKNGR